MHGDVSTSVAPLFEVLIMVKKNLESFHSHAVPKEARSNASVECLREAGKPVDWGDARRIEIYLRGGIITRSPFFCMWK
jgi:hypothetical protein